MCCTRCQEKFKDTKALLYHMNHPLGTCYSHFQELADLSDDLEKCNKNRHTHWQNVHKNMQLMDLGPDMDVDAMVMDDGELFVDE